MDESNFNGFISTFSQIYENNHKFYGATFMNVKPLSFDKKVPVSRCGISWLIKSKYFKLQRFHFLMVQVKVNEVKVNE